MPDTYIEDICGLEAIANSLWAIQDFKWNFKTFYDAERKEVKADIPLADDEADIPLAEDEAAIEADELLL